MVDLSYDPVADVLYIKFSSDKVKESDEISDGIIIDYSYEGNIVGIEVLNHSKRKIDLNKLIKMREEEIIAEVASCN